MKIKYNHARPFPKLLINLLLLAVSGILVYLICVQKTTALLMEWYEIFGKFLCDYDDILIAVILGANFLELLDFCIYSKRDEVINANYEYMQDHIGLLTFFKQYFAPLFAKGPYLFATEEKGSVFLRKAGNLITGLVKMIYWLAMALVLIAMAIHLDFRNFVISGNHDYIFTVLVLLACVNCNIFVYVFYKITPLYSARTYTLVTYYSDGSRTQTPKSQNNLVAMLLLSAFIYLYFTVFYLFAFGTKLKRMVETNRLLKFLNRCGEPESMLAFYRYK